VPVTAQQPTLDIANAPGAELLSEPEKALCLSLRIYPQQYLQAKEIMIAEYLKLGYLKRSTARNLLKIEASKTAKIFLFLEENGWINSTSQVVRPEGPLAALPPFASVQSSS
jgi:transcriptional adapter 2-alpha